MFRQAITWLYTGIAVSILGIWSLVVLLLLSLTAVTPEPGLLQLIALPSLLTFLVAKILVVTYQAQITSIPGSQPRAREGNLATWLATADYGSPHGALVLFLFSVTWLLHLAQVLFALFLLVIMSGMLVYATFLRGFDEQHAASGRSTFEDEALHQNFTTALAQVEDHLGVTFGGSLPDKPWLVLQLVLGLWAATGTLVLYVLGYAFGSVKQVLTTPMEAWWRTGGDGPVRVQVVKPQNGAQAVVAEKDVPVAPPVAAQ